MFAAWRVAVVLSATNLTGPAFASFTSGASGAEAATRRLHSAINTVKTVAAVGFVAAGASLSSFVGKGLDEAGKFELAMQNVAIATGASGKALKDLQAQALTISGNTSQDVTQIASEMAKAASAGLTTPQLKMMMPQIAAYADVQMRAHGVNPVDATSEAVQAAHLTRAYGNQEVTFRGKKETDLQAMLEYLNELSFTQPEDMKKVITQMGYFAPQGKALGMTMDDIMDALGVMGQTGYLKGKGGTGLGQIINGAINTVAITAHKQSAKTEALIGLGLVDRTGKPQYVNSKGQLDWPAMSAHLRAIAANTNPAHLHQMFQAAFNVNGGRMADVMFNPDTEIQRQRTRAKREELPLIQDAQNSYLGNYSVAWNTFWTNIHSAMATTFLPLAKAMTPVLRELAQAVQNFGVYMFQHPDLGLKISLGLVGTAVALMGTGAFIAAGLVSDLVISLRALAVASAAANIAAAPAAVGAGAGIGAWFMKVLGPILDGTLLAKMLTPKGFGAEFGKMFASDALGGLVDAIKIVATPLTWAARGFAILGGVFLEIIDPIMWVVTALIAAQQILSHPVEVGQFLGHVMGFLKYTFFPGVYNAFVAGLTAVSQVIITVFGAIIKAVQGLFQQYTAYLENPAAYLAGVGKNIQNWAAGINNTLLDIGAVAAQTSNSMDPNAIKPYTNNGTPVIPPSMKGGPGPTRAALAQNTGTNINGNITIKVEGSADPQATARAVAKVLTTQATFRQRAAGGTVNTPYLLQQAGVN